MNIILASSSPYRRQLLDKLGISYDCAKPDIDESALPSETADELVARLALEKAEAVAQQHPKALIIGSDQVATLNNTITTKPLNHDKAVSQLEAASGQSVVFSTGLCLLNTHTGQHQLSVNHFKVHFLSLSRGQIESYLHKEKPYDCAGSFKSEGLGITLFSQLEGSDPNSLIGLPLIELTAMLRKEGVDPLS